MNLRGLRWVADLNIPPESVEELRASGWDVRRPHPRHRSDREILRAAHRASRVVLTPDTDFGKLAVAEGEAFTGIVLVRPGHFPPSRLIETLKAAEQVPLTLDPPFILVLEQRGGYVRVRVRQPELGRPG